MGSLSGTQREIVFGTLLGDGTMRCKANALLEINHSVRQQSYVMWMYSQLASLVATPPRIRRSNGSRIACRFVTRSLPELTPIHGLFYESGRKRVPDLQLTPLTMAVWFMDDGSRSRRAVYFNTQQFSMQDQMVLLEQLGRQWGIEGSLNRDKCYYRIRISVESTRRLLEVIEPHVLPEMKYKFPQVTP